MKRSRSPITVLGGVALLAAMSLGIPVASLGSPPTEPPGRIYSYLPPSEHPDPIWVSAKELLGSKGQLDWQPLGHRAAEKWRRNEPYLNRPKGLAEGLQEVPEEACSVFEVSSWPSSVHPPDDGLLALLRGARVALVGTVVEKTPGFLLGSPATLLTVKIDESWRLPPSSVSPHLLIAYPEARFAVGGRVICGRHQKGAVAPEPGQTLVILAQGLPFDREGRLFGASLQELVVSAGGKTLSLPPNLARDDEMLGITTLDQFLAKIRLGFERLETSPHQEGQR
jgi:hypothetical protein